LTSGQVDSVDSLGIRLDEAQLQTIPLSVPAGAITSGDTIALAISARNACVGSGGKKGKARLWYDAAEADSRLTLEDVGTLYLRRLPGQNFALLENLGNHRRLENVNVGSPCGSFKSFGTWEGTVP
jgi:hypothetical protein